MLSSIQRDYAIIDKAASGFLEKLTGNNIRKDIALSAEMGGLMLLRASKVDLSKYPAGSVILGAITDDIYQEVDRFMHGWAVTNGLETTSVSKIEFSDFLKTVENYFPELTHLENGFYEVCKAHGIKIEYYPFVAISSAMRLVLAGEKTGLLKGKAGRAIAHYHVICGSKTVPYPVKAQK
jgi:hypothetical protein